MSQESVERVLGRLITDERFCRMAADSLESACRQEGYRLTSAELQMLSSLEQHHISEFTRHIDPGLCRALA